MPYCLAPLVSFCRVSNRYVFLDTSRDRYFCLPADAEGAFARLLDNEVLDESDIEQLDRLTVGGPLRSGAGADIPHACLAPPWPTSSLTDISPKTVSALQLALAAIQLVRTPWLLKRRGLDALLRSLARSRRPRGSLERRDTALRTVAAAFERLRFIATSNDRCLVRSVAVARRLRAVGLQPSLVIGVKLQPFRAHCWVQQDAVLVNDRVDVVRDFEPILVI